MKGPDDGDSCEDEHDGNNDGFVIQIQTDSNLAFKRNPALVPFRRPLQQDALLLHMCVVVQAPPAECRMVVCECCKQWFFRALALRSES